MVNGPAGALKGVAPAPAGLSPSEAAPILTEMTDFTSIRDIADPGPDRVPAGGCDWPGCGCEGQHRAPKSPATLDDYYWFCLEHIRAYNNAWNYYEGMDEEEIEREIRKDTCWRRPTWPMGASRGFSGGAGRFDDPFGVFEAASSDPADASDSAQPDARTPEGRAFRTLGLRPPTSLTELKARYKHLVKRLHPDVNGGDKDAEDRLKEINQAYASLKLHLAG